MLKELLSGSKAVTEGRSVLLPRINSYLMTRKKPSASFLIRDVRKKPDRRDFRFHPSDVSRNFCPRAWAMQQYDIGGGGASKAKTTDAKLERIFETGHMIHSMVQWWMADMGILYGRWCCSRKPNDEAHDQWGYGPGMFACAKCGGHTFYAEIPVDHAATNILGHEDGEIILDGNRWGVEIKGMNARNYEQTVREPFHDHRIQALLYLYVRSRKDGVMTHLGEHPRIARAPLKGMIVLYLNKDTMEVREHVIKLSSDLVASVIDPLLEKFAEAMEFVNEFGLLHGKIDKTQIPKMAANLPARPCATHAEGNHARCPLVDACFKLQPIPSPHKRKSLND
jgi:hypothetical protein